MARESLDQPMATLGRDIHLHQGAVSAEIAIFMLECPDASRNIGPMVLSLPLSVMIYIFSPS